MKIDKLSDRARAYVSANLGLAMPISVLDTGALPYYLQQDYQYFSTEINGLQCLLLQVPGADVAPATLEKHCQNLHKYFPELEPIILSESLSAHNRKRLIERKVAFIVPNNQMYLPLLGLDLREHFKRQRQQQRIEKLSPTSQLLLLWHLQKSPIDNINSAQMAERLNLSRMSVARAYDELAKFDWVALAALKGNQKALALALSGEALWQEVKHYLKSPVRKVRYVLGELSAMPAYVAGESALASYTLMGDPSIPVKAIKAEEWEGLQKLFALQELPQPEPGCIALQTWRYAPELFASNNIVDPLSLYLSFEKEQDPRLRMAADELEKGMSWKQGK